MRNMNECDAYHIIGELLLYNGFITGENEKHKSDQKLQNHPVFCLSSQNTFPNKNDEMLIILLWCSPTTPLLSVDYAEN